MFVSPASPTPAWGLEFSGLATPGPTFVEMETTGPPKFLGNPRVPMPCSQTPAGPHAPGHSVRQHGSRVVNREGTSRPVSFGAQSHGLGTRCLRFAAPVTGAPRQTRFRSLARLSRMVLVTHRVPLRGFRSNPYTSSSFPKLLGAMTNIHLYPILSRTLGTRRKRRTRPKCAPRHAACQLLFRSAVDRFPLRRAR